MTDVLPMVLFQISNALLVPVVLALLLLGAWTLLNVGGLLTEFIHRARNRSSFTELVSQLKSQPDLSVSAEDVPDDFHLLARAFSFPRESREKVLDDLQLDCEQVHSQLQIGTRLGPVLGLIGTLIPLGPALLALSSGDISTLSRQLVVAFSTTVLGLLIGGICFVLTTCRRSWYDRDLSDLSYVFSRMD
ncbi:MotA/TolQ/ExbB proton channel family protein [Calycomorphotria hydatis]|uniref:MotA/TolQ/ExbB proton channel domain-containing protein n=1 Tax=Calycomorphotria hydatis TaxID=2528027 RepID=A0A517TD76_9PLAN|nr:MotA/TolQ/ExbB proton channel family protein [Calycomorphotria hydatis]QDT66325.1 hypothetical protein V22_35910 [Calycomorphotria hydatis]